MNTSLISHRMFVAALTNDGHAVGKPPPAGRSVESNRLTQNGVAQPSPETLAALAARPWVNWPFGGGLEERPAS